ncbi:MAG: hypothetical protein QG588_1278 [Candidatus Poribacteria bacterium]|nr:hypothetical protein [Candidatus Poribacteria bacterium]
MTAKWNTCAEPTFESQRKVIFSTEYLSPFHTKNFGLIFPEEKTTPTDIGSSITVYIAYISHPK